MSAQGAVLRPMPPTGINRPIPISVPGRRFSYRKSKRRTRSRRSRRSRRTRSRRSNKKWIQKIHMKKGALRSMAPPSAFTSRGTLKVSWLKWAAKQDGKLGKRARLALVLRNKKRKFSRKRKRKFSK